MTETAHILIVDDTKDSRLMLNMMLEDDYQLTEVDSGQACLDAINEQLPDLVLLDVEMPCMTGYEVCTTLRKQSATKFLPIIFVSALDSTDERLAGFEAGGNDYLIKPVDENNLLEKIETVLQKQNELKASQQQASSATNMAMEAMTVSGELGQIINFVKKVQLLDSPESVALAVINLAKEFSLNSSAMVITDVHRFIACEPNSLEAKLLAQVADSDERIFSVGIRTVVKNKHIVLLLKNMPLDDENFYGRLKDHLAVFMDIADGHLATLEARDNVVKQRKEFLKQIIAVAEEQINRTQEKLLDYDKNSQQIMQGMLAEMEDMLFSLGLDEDQEKKLMSLADKASLKLEELSQTTQNLGSELGVILEKLYEFFAKEK